MSLDLGALRAATARYGAVVRVVIAGKKGSSPRGPGTAMLIWADGQDGTIGGGALEYDAAARARAMLARETAAQVERAALGPALGQCCGGAVTLVYERFDAARVAMIDPDAPYARALDDRPMPLSIRRALSRWRGGADALALRLDGGWMVEPITRPSRALWIWGAGHVGRALVAILAPLPEIAITWADTTPDRFPDPVPAGVTALPAANPADLVARAPIQAEHLIVTYSHALDLELCHRLLGHGFAGAGLIGSASKWAHFRARLRALGHGDAQIARIACPIGDPALGNQPQAIAIGVAAALLIPQHATRRETAP